MPSKTDLMAENQKLRTELTLLRSSLGSRAKLTAKHILEIRALAPKMTQAELAVRYHVTQPAISYLLSGKTYKNVA